MSYQRIVICGNLGKDVEVRMTQQGKTVANFPVAVSESKDKTEWFSVQLWEKSAEIAAKYLAKGSKCIVEGRMETRSWEKDGQKHYKTELIGSRLILIDRKKDDEAQKPYECSTAYTEDDVTF